MRKQDALTSGWSPRLGTAGDLRSFVVSSRGVTDIRALRATDWCAPGCCRNQPCLAASRRGMPSYSSGEYLTFMRRNFDQAVRRGELCEEWARLEAAGFRTAIAHEIGFPPTLMHELAVLMNADGLDAADWDERVLILLRPRNVAWWTALDGYTCGWRARFCAAVYGSAQELLAHRRDDHVL